jgi:hypothetical protein
MGACYQTIAKERRKYGDHGTRQITQVIGAENVLPSRQVVSLSGDGGFTMLMGDFHWPDASQIAGEGRRFQRRPAWAHRAPSAVNQECDQTILLIFGGVQGEG